MLNERELFKLHVGQTSPDPMLIEAVKAKGVYFYDKTGKEYIDLVSGVSVSNLGHCHPAVVEAVKNQVDKYMHLMVYGEYVQSPQVQYAKLLTENLPPSLNSIYFVNSGSEAVEGALKLAKRYTERYEIIACKNAYHGSTQGALSLYSDADFKKAYAPLLPNIRHIEFNNEKDIDIITEKTACVIVEAVQAEGGIILPANDYLVKLREKCNQTGTLLIVDEVQTGFGRTGKLFGFENFGFVPDIITIAKAMGGGMPIGAFVADRKLMEAISINPELGHITTFGGHPVSCAAALASLKYMLNSNLIDDVNRKGQIFKERIQHESIKEIRGLGLFYAVELKSAERVPKVISRLMENGVIVDWFLYHPLSFRIAPPLIISDDVIEKACSVINEALKKE